MVRVIHVLKLWAWSRTLRGLPRTIGVRKCSLITLFLELHHAQVSFCYLSIFLPTHLRISDFWLWSRLQTVPRCYFHYFSFIGILQMPEFTWRIFTEFESTWNFILIQRVFLFTAWSLWGFLSLAVSLFCLRMGCRRRRSSFSSLTTVQISLYLFIMTETTWVSFWTLSMCLPPKTLSPLSSQRKLSCLFDTWWLIPLPQHRRELWSFQFSSSDQFEVFTDVFNRKYLVCPLFRTVSWFVQSQDSLMLNRVL